ncbi:MAG: AI-2E family transporter [Solirubrobacterales bacterium]|nr:AI-2E family transporter [Solirubrobacterales bacterium]MBV9716657.1 AI-2E family transporter [Solirubrobacterales bacterium]
MNESRITPSVLYKTVLLAFGLVVLGLVIRQLATLILGVLIVVIIAAPISALATWLQRFRVPRGFGAVLGLLIGLGAFGALVAALVPVFTHEINQFANSLPGIVDELRHRLGALTGTSPSHVGQQVQKFVNGYTQHPAKLLGPLESIGASVVAAIAAIIVVLLTALYTAIHPDPLVSGVVRLAPPARRPVAKVILSRLRVTYLAWLRGLIFGMFVLGGMTYVGLLIAGLPFASFFAIFTAVAMIIPYFGALASSIPPILYALTFSPGKAVVVALIYIVAHQVESNMIQPLVVARVVELHPAAVAVGVIAVERLFGFVGLIVAVPILVTIKILIEELWIRPIERQGFEIADEATPMPPPEERVIITGARGP